MVVWDQGPDNIPLDRMELDMHIMAVDMLLGNLHRMEVDKRHRTNNMVRQKDIAPVQHQPNSHL